jgi:hypothetical protein
MNTKIVGKFFQSETIALNYGNIDNPKLLNNMYFQKVDFDPIVPIPILHKKAKVTDLVSCVNATSAGQLIISKKLKNIIEKHRTKGLQFFKTSIIKEDIEYDDYFSLNMYETNNEFIDFSKTTIIYRKYNPKKMNETELIKVDSIVEFNSLIDNRNILDEISLNNICIKNDVSEDLFMIKYGVKHIVSESLKKEIEDAGCTGIEFQPVELSYNEWTAPGGEREKKYGKM